MQDDHSQPSGKRPSFSWRALISVLVTASSIILVLSGIMLFVSPPGRVANWTDWRLAGLSKRDWSGLHVWFAAVFLVVAIFHLILNIRPLLNHLRNRRTRRLGFRWEWAVALVLCGLVFGGTRAGWTPFSTLLTFNERVKRSWEDPRARAPIPHAELLTLEELCEQAQVPYETAVQRLEARGCKNVQSEVHVADLAGTNALTPQRIFEIIQGQRERGFGGGRAGGAEAGATAQRDGGGGRGGFGGLGGGRGSGAGRKTLREYCADEQVDLQNALALLQAKGIRAAPDKTLRDIALDSGVDRPFELIDMLRAKTPAETNAVVPGREP